MLSNHVVAWIDHAQAHVIHFNPEAAETEVIKTHSSHPHNKSNASTAESAHYFNAVASALNGAREILLVGPGLEKQAFMKHLEQHHHGVAKCVMGVETVDHPTDGQLLKYARKYFLKVDQML